MQIEARFNVEHPFLGGRKKNGEVVQPKQVPHVVIPYLTVLTYNTV